MRKLFNLTTVAIGAATGLIIVGVLAIAGGTYAKDVVHDQLVPQKIFFPAAGKDHGTINSDLGLPDDEPTKALFEFLDGALK